MKYRLGDICSITKGATGIMKAVPGEYEMVTLGEEHKTHNEYQFDAKAVIIPLVSSTGHGHASMKRVKYCEGKFALGTILCAVIPHDEKFVLAKYLQIYLHWNREELLVSQMKGMANVTLPMNRIADVEVIVPSMEKQQYIVDLEAKLVEKGDALDRLFSDQLTQIENLNQAILQEAVQGKLVPQDPNDEPATELLKRIKAEKEKANNGKKQKPLPPIKPEEIPFEIPKSWAWCRFSEIYDVRDGTHDSPKYHKEGYPFITSKNLVNGTLDFSNVKYISQKDHVEFSKRSKVEIGDILFAVIGTIGNPVIVSKMEKEFSIKNVALFKNFAKALIETKFIFWLLEYSTKELKNISRGGIQKFVSLQILRNLRIPLPPLHEQKRIVEEIEKQLAKTQQLKEYITANQEATEQLLKAMLQEAFGERKVEIAKPKIVEYKPTNVDYYRRTVLAAEIVWQLHKEPTLGHVKLQKLIYLCQKSTDMQLPTNFLRQAMGPYDPQLMRSIDAQLKKRKWFRYKRDEALKYQPLERVGQHQSDFLKYFSEHSDRIHFIINKFKPTKTDIVGIVATLYACLDEMQNESVVFSEALLIQRFYEWSEEKKKFDKEQVKDVFLRMKKTGIIPKGYNFLLYE